MVIKNCKNKYVQQCTVMMEMQCWSFGKNHSFIYTGNQNLARGSGKRIRAGKSL